MHLCKGPNKKKLIHFFKLQKSITIYLVYRWCFLLKFVSFYSSWKFKFNHKFVDIRA